MDKSTRFLVVDDFPTMCRIIKNLLTDLGYQNTQIADDGRSALTILQKEKIDFVITDWNMPDIDGIELLKRIRRDPVIKHLPVLMVTAESNKAQIIEAVRAGINGYIIKPFNAETLSQKLERIDERMSAAA